MQLVFLNCVLDFDLLGISLELKQVSNKSKGFVWIENFTLNCKDSSLYLFALEKAINEN